MCQITQIIPKSDEMSFVHNIHFISPIVLKFCIPHDSITVMLSAKFYNDWATNISYE